MNSYQNVFGNGVTLLGNSQVGPQAAAAAAVGASQLKVYNPNSRVGVIGPGAGNWQSPIHGLTGEISVPAQVAPPAYFDITIDTTQETEAVDIVLFDAKNLYSNDRCGSCATDKTAGGCVYTGSQACNRYDSIVNMLCSNNYVIKSLRVLVCSSNGSESCGFASALSTRIMVWKGNLNNDTMQSSINLINHVSSQNYNNNIIDVPLTGHEGLLDQFTAWHMTVEPGTKLLFTFFVAARG